MFASEEGSITAEFAVILPAVLMVLLLALGSIMLSTQKLVLTAVAAEVARHEARGDHIAAQTSLAALGFEASVQRASQGALHCVTLQASPAGGLLSTIRLSSRACAALSEAGT